MRKILLIIFIFILCGTITACLSRANTDTEWYYPEWTLNAKYNQPITVLDTESALGRYALKTKKFHLKILH
jgi:hypothetical protein